MGQKCVISTNSLLMIQLMTLSEMRLVEHNLSGRGHVTFKKRSMTHPLLYLKLEYLDHGLVEIKNLTFKLILTYTLSVCRILNTVCYRKIES